MLSQRILATLKFFDLQDMPLTLLELEKFLIADVLSIKKYLNIEFEVIGNEFPLAPQISANNILICLEKELNQEVESHNGYYCLSGRKDIIKTRLSNYFFGFKREKRITKYLWFLKYIPFIRGVAIGGSQALGQQKERSDIDLLIITDQKFMWLGRTLVSVFFQIFGVRRYKEITQNRFCLNHYLAEPKALDRELNLYKAMEYLRLRPVVYQDTVSEFLQNNQNWIKLFFPNAWWPRQFLEKQSVWQFYLEKIFQNALGNYLENFLKKVETKRIKQDKYTFITKDELSFHPESRHNQLLENFFQS